MLKFVAKKINGNILNIFEASPIMGDQRLVKKIKYLGKGQKTRFTNVVRNAGCAPSRYTLKL